MYRYDKSCVAGRRLRVLMCLDSKFWRCDNGGDRRLPQNLETAVDPRLALGRKPTQLYLFANSTCVACRSDSTISVGFNRKPILKPYFVNMPMELTIPKSWKRKTHFSRINRLRSLAID